MPGLTLGIDIGTSSVKAGLLELESGRLLNISQRSYASGALQSTEVIWESTLEVLQEAFASAPVDKSIFAVGLSGQMHGTVMYDSHDRVIEPLINWQDKRCDQPLEKYNGKTTVEMIAESIQDVDVGRLGVDCIASGFLGATYFHIKENDPGLYNSIRYVTLPADFIRGKLLGIPQRSTDPTNAASTGLFDVTRSVYHLEVLERLGLPSDRLPEVNKSNSTAGVLSRQVCELVGLPYQIEVVYGGGDLQMSVLGSGTTTPGSPDLLNIGTGAQIARITSSFKKLPGIDTWPFFGGHYLYIGASLGGGASYQWLRDMLRSKFTEEITYAEMDDLAARVPPGSNGLQFCSGPSRQDPGRELGFYGNLSKSDDIGCMARAVMEGVLLDLYGYRQQMGEQDRGSMLGTGNGLRKSRVWSQIAADMFNRKLLVVDTENTVYGAALLAASRHTEHKDLHKTAGKIAYSNFEPDSINAALYRENTGAYK